MTEQWIQWRPIDGLGEKYYIDYISDDFQAFKIYLSQEDDEEKKVLMTFENSISAYRRIDETFRLKLISDLKEKYGSNFYGKWTFFRVDNSAYIKWISEQSCGISSDIPFVHFSLIGFNSILDIITTYEPKIELINEININQ